MSDPILLFGETQARRAPGDTQLLLRGDPRDRATLAACCDIDLSATMLTSATAAGWSALHLSPDEWLLIGPEDEGGAMTARFDDASVALSLVDVSDRSVAIDLSGPRAVELLAGGCPLDLAGVVPGGCTRTLFGKATILLWRRGDVWRVSHARSYDAYVVDLLRAVVDDLASA